MGSGSNVTPRKMFKTKLHLSPCTTFPSPPKKRKKKKEITKSLGSSQYMHVTVHNFIVALSYLPTSIHCAYKRVDPRNQSRSIWSVPQRALPVSI